MLRRVDDQVFHDVLHIGRKRCGRQGSLQIVSQAKDLSMFRVDLGNVHCMRVVSCQALRAYLAAGDRSAGRNC
jgi:hypothetical protein